jgi:hypothetical protein
VSANLTAADRAGKVKTAERLRLQLKALGRDYVKALDLPGWPAAKKNPGKAISRKGTARKNSSDAAVLAERRKTLEAQMKKRLKGNQLPTSAHPVKQLPGANKKHLVKSNPTAAIKAAALERAWKIRTARLQALREENTGRNSREFDSANKRFMKVVARYDKTGAIARNLGLSGYNESDWHTKNVTVKKAKKNAARKRNSLVWGEGKKGSTWKPGRRPSKRARVKRNSGEIAAAVDKYQEFHGRDPETVHAFKSTVTLDDTVSGLGKLVLLEVIAMNGERVELGGFRGSILAQDIDGTQLHIVGGDQSVDVETFGVRGERRYEMLGLVELVAYHTTKDHLGEEDGGTADYHHEFGENGGALPCLMYDTVDQRLTLVGGDYRLLSVGIDD